MAFVLSRPSNNHQDPHIDSYPVPFTHVHTPSSDHHDMTVKEKDQKIRVEILLDSSRGYVFLRGVGVDVEPTLLSGHVALYLSEATPLKEITLQFRGKARLPVPTSESTPLNSAPLTYIVCNHDWSFLEGEKNTSHTLKAGRHLFPFQVRIGGSLPSTISSPAFGGAAVSYKLHAQVVRSGFFHHTYHATLPVHIIRSFAAEAMEYQQSLEIENTWPEKLMYSIMVPHKAWAAGDKLTALVKFSPLVKGVCVLNVHTSIHEQTNVYSRSGPQEQTRLVASVKHEIVNGKAIEIENHRMRQAHTPSYPSTPASPASSSGSNNGAFHQSSSSSSLSSLGRSYVPHVPLHGLASTSSASPPASPVVSSNAAEDSVFESESQEVMTYLNISIPLTVTPSHSPEPISVSHRIRWSITILNHDGHTSELRCSLPLHLLDYRLLNESRNFTAATRRLLIGGPEVAPAEEEDVQLPSYNQHIRDRVANMFLPESATMRVTNPWISQGANPVHVVDAPTTSWPLTESGHCSPLEAHLLTNLPHQPDPNSSSAPLEWVNSELLLSLSDNPPPRLCAESPHNINERESRGSTPSPTSQSRSHSRSRPSSRGLSRLSSRNNSPEHGRDHQRRHQHHHHPHHRHTGNDSYLHNQTHASRSTENVFSTIMKPLTSFSPSFLSRPLSGHHPTAEEVEAAQQPQGGVRKLNVPDASSGTELLHRAFTEVPDYTVASRGFIGGVPPLTSMQGLPSYDESVRSSSGHRSETGVTRRFGEMSIGDSEDAHREGEGSSSSTISA